MLLIGLKWEIKFVIKSFHSLIFRAFIIYIFDDCVFKLKQNKFLLNKLVLFFLNLNLQVQWTLQINSDLIFNRIFYFFLFSKKYRNYLTVYVCEVLNWLISYLDGLILDIFDWLDWFYILSYNSYLSELDVHTLHIFYY